MVKRQIRSYYLVAKFYAQDRFIKYNLKVAFIIWCAGWVSFMAIWALAALEALSKFK